MTLITANSLADPICTKGIASWDVVKAPFVGRSDPLVVNST